MGLFVLISTTTQCLAIILHIKEYHSLRAFTWCLFGRLFDLLQSLKDAAATFYFFKFETIFTPTLPIFGDIKTKRRVILIGLLLRFS